MSPTLYARSYSTGAARTNMAASSGSRHLIPLSSALRKFYLKVHPDLFAGHPKEQETNEKSFAILTEYLDNYKQEAESATPYKVEFYVRVKVIDADKEEMKHVTALLTLPSKHASAEAREHILKNNITKLFRQCDYHDDVDVRGYGSSNKRLRHASAHETSIISVVMAASQRFKGTTVGKKSAAQAELDKVKEKLKASNTALQEKLRKEYGIKFGLEVPAVLFPSSTDRLKMIQGWLQNVKTSLEELKLTDHKMSLLKDKTIIFGYKKQGPLPSNNNPNSVYLEIYEGRQSWAETLQSINPESDKLFQEKMEQKLQRETETAAALGLRRIESSVPITLRQLDKYLTLLQRLHMHAMAKPEEWKQLNPNRSRITIRVVDRIDGIFVSELPTGTILLTLDRNVADLHTLLKEQGAKFAVEVSEFEKAVLNIKDRYGLAQLAVAPNVTSENAVDGLSRFIDGYNVLRQYFTGMNVCIANDYSANEDSKVLFVKYDFLY